MLLKGAIAFSQAANDSISKDTIQSSSKTKVQLGGYIHSPKKAALYSTLVPGLGQIYNKKYWKTPIIYAGLGTLFYFAVFNNKYYNKYKDALIAHNDTIKSNDYLWTSIVKSDLSSAEAELQYYRDYYRRYRDLSYIGLVGLYVLNIIDATVDAHFYTYDISNNLSLKIEPTFHNNYSMNATVGLKCSLIFSSGNNRLNHYRKYE